MKMLIVKIGGGKSVLDNLDNILSDFASLSGKKILVHGANYEAGAISEKLGKKPVMITSASGFESRRTDRETLEILMMAYSGVANKRIVEKLQKLNVNAVGLSGLDGRIWEGPRKPFVKAAIDGKVMMIRDDFTGKVEKVNTHLINLLLDNGYVPVLTIPGISYEGEAINLDNDRALAVMAGSLGCKEVVMLFEAPGLLKDHNDESSLIPAVSGNEIESAVENTNGRMKKKMLGVKEALELGVEKIYFGDLRKDKPITRAMNKEGTVIG
jgi:[amino group carrier protein]-L-2-aminoadipate 6-kinase